MAHPYASHRQDKVEKSRASKIAHGRAAGGGVHSDEAADKTLIKQMVRQTALKADDGKTKHRADRPGRKKGGRVKSAKTVVNVITGGAQPPVAGLGPAAAPPAPPPVAPPAPPMPPMGAKPPMMPPGGPVPGGPGPGMMPVRKRGGRVNDGTKVFNKSMKEAGERPVKHIPGKNDLKDMNRGRVVTFKTGGGVVSFRASGGRIESPQGVAKATKLPGGAGGGEGRLAKAHRAKRK